MTTVNVSAPEVTVDLLTPAVNVGLVRSVIEVAVAQTPITIDLGVAGPGIPELHDSATAPADPTYPYLRFERDGDGDVQYVYLGTSD